MPRLFKKREGSIGLHWYKGYSFMWNLIQFIINFNLIDNRGKFKEGDLVKYNWRAKIHLKSLFDNGWITTEALVVTAITYSDKSGVEYITPKGEPNGCDPFWLRKLYWWEY